MGNFTTIILRNRHSSKRWIYHYTQRSVHLLTLIKEASFCNAWLLTQKAPTSQLAEKKRLRSPAQHGTSSHISSSPQGPGILVESEMEGFQSQRQWMISRKLYSRQIWPHRSYKSTYMPCVRKKTNMEGLWLRSPVTVWTDTDIWKWLG